MELNKRQEVEQSGAVALLRDDVTDRHEATEERAPDESLAGVGEADQCTDGRHQLHVTATHGVNHEEEGEDSAAEQQAAQALKEAVPAQKRRPKYERREDR